MVRPEMWKVTIFSSIILVAMVTSTISSSDNATDDSPDCKNKAELRLFYVFLMRSGQNLVFFMKNKYFHWLNLSRQRLKTKIAEFFRNLFISFRHCETFVAKILYKGLSIFYSDSLNRHSVSGASLSSYEKLTKAWLTALRMPAASFKKRGFVRDKVFIHYSLWFKRLINLKETSAHGGRWSRKEEMPLWKNFQQQR